MKDEIYKLQDHESNIPYITFCNTDSDRTGHWLLSGDINGYCYVWDLQTRAMVFKYKAWMCTGDDTTVDCVCHLTRVDVPHGGM